MRVGKAEGMRDAREAAAGGGRWLLADGRPVSQRRLSVSSPSRSLSPSLSLCPRRRRRRDGHLRGQRIADSRVPGALFAPAAVGLLRSYDWTPAGAQVELVGLGDGDQYPVGGGGVSTAAAIWPPASSFYRVGHSSLVDFFVILFDKRIEGKFWQVESNKLQSFKTTERN